jgi:competence protein ComEA
MLSRLLTPKEQLVILGLGCAICLGALALYVHDGAAPAPAGPDQLPALPNAPEVVPESTEVQGDSEPQNIIVAITGAVKKPDVYEIQDGQRVRDLLERAGGATTEADLQDINQAAMLIDGTTLSVPRRSAAEPPPNPPQYTLSGWENITETGTSTQVSPESRAGLIDLNRANQAELESLPGIGPKLAAEIIRYREQHAFRSVDDVDGVSGIGEKRLAAIRPFVTVAPR